MKLTAYEATRDDGSHVAVQQDLGHEGAPCYRVTVTKATEPVMRSILEHLSDDPLVSSPRPPAPECSMVVGPLTLAGPSSLVSRVASIVLELLSAPSGAGPVGLTLSPPPAAPEPAAPSAAPETAASEPPRARRARRARPPAPAAAGAPSSTPDDPAAPEPPASPAPSPAPALAPVAAAPEPPAPSPAPEPAPARDTSILFVHVGDKPSPVVEAPPRAPARQATLDLGGAEAPPADLAAARAAAAHWDEPPPVVGQPAESLGGDDLDDGGDWTVEPEAPPAAAPPIDADRAAAVADRPVTPPPAPAGAPWAPSDALVRQLAGMTSLKEILRTLHATGAVATEVGLIAVCERIQTRVPVLDRIASLRDRVPRTLESMGLSLPGKVEDVAAHA